MQVPRITTDSGSDELLGLVLEARLGRLEHLPEMVKNLEDNLSLAFFTKNAQYYRASFVDLMMKQTFACWIRGDGYVMRAVEKAWEHWGAVLAMLNPVKWLQFCNTVIEHKEYKDLMFSLNGSINDAIGKLPKEDRVRWWPFVSNHVKTMQNKHLVTVGDNVLELCGELMPPAAARELLNRFGNDMMLVHAMVKLCEHQHGLFNVAVAEKELPIVLAIIKQYKRHVGYGQVFARVAEVCGNLESSDNEVALDIVIAGINQLEELGDEEVEELEPIFEKAGELIGSKHVDRKTKAKLLEILRLGVARKVLEKDLSEFVELDSGEDALTAVSVRIGLENPEKGLADENAKEMVAKLALSHHGETYISLLDGFAKCFKIVKDGDASFALRLVRLLISPLPAKEYARPVLEFLLSLDEDVLFHSTIALNAENVFLQYYTVRDDDVFRLLSEFVRRTCLEIDPTKVDFMGEVADMVFKYGPAMDRDLLMEVLEYQVIPTHHVRHAIDMIGRLKRGGHVYFFYLVTLLQMTLVELRLDVWGKYANVGHIDYVSKETDHKWMSMIEMHKLFASIHGDYTKSEFGLLQKSLLDAISCQFDYDSNDNELYAKLAVLVGLTMNIFPIESASILRKLSDANKQKGNSDVLARGIEVAMTCILRKSTPWNGAPAVAELVLEMYGIHNSWERYERHILIGAQLDRYIASRVADDLNQPLPPMKTFLSFVDSKKHSEWVDLCQHSFPPDQWILLPDDASTIRKLPKTQGTERIHEEALALIAKLRRVEEPKAPYKIPKPTFQCNEPSVVEIDDKIRSTEPATLENVIAYLWHNTNDLPDGFTREKLEALAVAHPSNMRLLAGFFSWAAQSKCDIDTVAWAKRFSINSFGTDTVLAISSFLLHVHEKFTELSLDIRILIDVALQILGRGPYSDATITDMFIHSTGLEWVLARSVILIDLDHWQSWSTLLPILYGDVRYAKAFLTQDVRPKTFYADIYTILSEMFLVPDHMNDVRLMEMIPVRFGSYRKMMRFCTEEELPRPVTLDAELLELLLKELETSDNIPESYWNLFFSISLTEDQVQRVDKLMGVVRGSLYAQRYYLPANFNIGSRSSFITISGSVYPDVNTFYWGKPPSFGRCYIRSTQTPFSKRLGSEFETVLRTQYFAPIHPALIYTGQAHYNLAVAPNGLASSLLRYGVFSPEIGQELLQTLNKHSHESIENGRALLTLPDAPLSKLMKHCVSDTERSEIVQQFIASLGEEESGLLWTIDCIKFLASAVKLENLLVLICSRDFINKPNFACAFAAFHVFERIVKEKAAELADFTTAFHDSESGLFDSPSKTEAFSNPSKPETISAILHEIH